MKKLYSILGLCAMFALPTFAQEEDMTSYIANPGFDEDLTWQADGSTKEIVDKSVNISSRSQVYRAEDGTTYAHALTKSEGNGTYSRSDALAWNGFFGQIKGWTAVSDNQAKPEWVYFGSVAYGMGETAIPIADNGSTYLATPEKPAEDSGDDNVGALYLRAGWGAKAVYKQVVALPCAQYRLEYWIYNANYEGSKNNTSVVNLCKVTCRKDVFEDTEGFSTSEWTKHTIEFTPTSEFTIEFGFQSAGGSGSNPFLFIDGIKLYKIGDADPAELLQADIMDMVDQINGVIEENLADFGGIADEVAEKMSEFEDIAYGEEPEAMEQALKDIKAYALEVEAMIATTEELYGLVGKVNELIDAEETYPGLSDLQAALSKAEDAISSGTMSDVTNTVTDLNQAIKDYYMSQVVTPEKPANYSFLVQNPEFCVSSATPSYADGIPTYPNEGSYTSGSAPSDATSAGWVKGSVTTGDQRLNYAQGRICWNLWDNHPGYHEVYQTLSGIPNGYYTISGDMITQADFPNDQHMYAVSSTSSVESPYLTEGNWSDNNDGAWTTLTTEKIAVVDGKLKIGAASTFPENSAKGWFCLTHVVLKYYGPLTDEEVAALLAQKVADCKAEAEAMHFAADKATYLEAINAVKSVEDLDALNEAQAIAKTSETEYNNVIAGSYNDLITNIADVYSANAKKVAQVPVDYMTNYLGSAEATYTATADITAVLRYYRDNLIPAIEEAESKEIADATGKAALQNTIASVIAKLGTYEPDTEVLAGYIAELNAAIAVAEKSDIAYADGADVTGYITNPTIDSISAWTVNKPVGDGNGCKTGQQYDGNTAGGYLDTYNSAAGSLRATMYQVLNVPNGTYKVQNIMRNSGGGAYLFASTAEPVKDAEDNLTLDAAATNVIAKAEPVATNVIKYVNAEAEETSAVYNDSYGELWMAAADKVIAALGIATAPIDADGSRLYDLAVELNNGSTDCPDNVDAADWSVFAANSGKGRGWFNNSLEITVTDHVLVIGATCDSKFTAPAGGEEFTGTWFSADNFTLTLVKAGDNAGWNAATGVETVETAAQTVAVYSIAGARVNGLQKGINIVKMSNGTVKKVLVK